MSGVICSNITVLIENLPFFASDASNVSRVRTIRFDRIFGLVISHFIRGYQI